MSNTETTLRKPNLFKMGTKELTHDAVYSWFLTWSSKEYADSPDEQDQKMHKLGVAFLAMLSGFSTKELSGKTVKVHRQWHKIDIMVEVEGTLVLAIENKTFSSLGAHQQKTYSERAIEHSKRIKIPNVVFSYVKTGSDPKSKINEIEAFKPSISYNHYSVKIVRNQNIIDLCSKAKDTIQNETFKMFLEYINELEDLLQTKDLKRLKSSYLAFERVLHKIQDGIEERGFKHVKFDNKPYKGYCCLWYGSQNLEKYQLDSKSQLHIELWLKKNIPDAMIIYGLGTSTRDEQTKVVDKLMALGKLNSVNFTPEKSGKGRILLKVVNAFKVNAAGELDFDHLVYVNRKLEDIMKQFA